MNALLPVNKIIASSCVDGPGNRTAVFFQGCNFRCTYCHNPETINLCNDCGLCVSQCPENALKEEAGIVKWDQGRCIGCDSCISVCPNSASPKVRMMTVTQLGGLVEANLPFISGVTFSGGECMLQVELLTALCERLSKSVGSVLLDSNGSIDFSAHPQLMGSCNGVMLDIKILDETRHKEITGQSNAMVIKNALYLIRHNKLAEVRTVVVPDVLPNEDTVIRTAELLARSITNGKRIPYRLIRFRPNGTKGEANSYRTPKMEYMQYLEQCLEAYGCFKPIVV